MLAFAVASRWFHLFGVNPNFAFITHNWAIALLALLTIVDFVADKIPFVDHVWNAVHKVVRPVWGQLLRRRVLTIYLLLWWCPIVDVWWGWLLRR
jgi:hypothetical protein